MTNVTVIVDDRAVSVDFFKYEDISYDWPTDIWAIQWDGTAGTIEYRDQSSTSATIEDVQPYIDLFNQHDELVYQDNKTNELARDVQEAAREERNDLLKATDEWALSDRVMTDAQRAYRQALRDLPLSADWNPQWSWNSSNENRAMHYVEVSGVTWPTKP